jgi:uncharacterized protein YjbJ (UPF0337 family)
MDIADTAGELVLGKVMAMDKVNYTVINHLGAAKEGAGRLAGNDDLQREGQHDQAKAKLQEAGERARYAAADIGERVQGTARSLKRSFGKDQVAPRGHVVRIRP